MKKKMKGVLVHVATIIMLPCVFIANAIDALIPSKQKTPRDKPVARRKDPEMNSGQEGERKNE